MKHKKKESSGRLTRTNEAGVMTKGILEIGLGFEDEWRTGGVDSSLYAFGQ